MNGRILPFEPRGHDEAQRLLPWLVNGSLAQEQRGWLETHVAGCASCRGERALLEDLHAVVLAEEESAAGVDAGWRRVRACVQPRAPAPSRWQAWQRQWARAPRWVGWSLATQAALLVALGGLLLFVPQRQDAVPAAYRTLGTVPPSGNLLVMFDPRLREAQWRGLLQASDARIVDGPNATGAYVLAVPPARAAQACGVLRAAVGIALVERLDGGRCAP